MSKLFLSLLIGSALFTACRKDSFSPAPVKNPAAACQFQTDNPAGRSYSAASIVDVTCTEKHCGMLPLSSKNYWVYEDSVFSNGVFLHVQLDTLRFSSNKKSLSDGLIWWEPNINIGLPAILYSNDSSFYTLADRLFAPELMDARKEYGLFPGDSVKYLTSFDDVAANGRSVKWKTPVSVPAGTFTDCIFFEKHARYYRKDQVFFKPGLGVVKYIMEKAQPGSMILKLQQVSTLRSVHIE